MSSVFFSDRTSRCVCEPDIWTDSVSRGECTWSSDSTRGLPGVCNQAPFHHPCMLSLLLLQSINYSFFYVLFHHSSRQHNWMAWAQEGPDFIVINIIFLLWCTRKIIYSCFSPTVIPPFYVFFFLFPVWESLLGPFLFIWVRQCFSFHLCKWNI